MKIETLKKLASMPGNQEAILQAVASEGPSWKAMAQKYIRFLNTGTPEFTVFAKGNGKLPFYAFSTLPAETCPGAGDCLNWCYSFKAWRYPAAFFRQMQNTVLVRMQSELLVKAWMQLPKGKTVRLYVDGDIDSLATLEFWMDNCEKRADLSVYGYSKSWMVFLQHKGDWPANYILNLSQGSRYGDGIKRLMQQLPIVRGEFIALPISKEAAKAGHKSPEYNRAVRSAANEKVFVCPGKCGDCANGKHACGNSRFNGVKIAIGIH